MLKPLALALILAPSVAVNAQSPVTNSQDAAAPIVRSAPTHYPGPQLFDTQPAAGLFVRTDLPDAVQTVTASPTLTELRILRGRADITVHHPANHSQILVDLPGGQVSLFKDGLYTFNAATNTVRVLHGEAEAFLGPKDAAKGVKVKETQQLAFYPNAPLKAVNAYPYELTADLLPGAGATHGDGPPNRFYRNGYEGYYPYYAYGYGYPYGFGYPFGVGLGFGYYGGFGGFRGGGFRR